MLVVCLDFAFTIMFAGWRPPDRWSSMQQLGLDRAGIHETVLLTTRRKQEAPVSEASQQACPSPSLLEAWPKKKQKKTCETC